MVVREFGWCAALMRGPAMAASFAAAVVFAGCATLGPDSSPEAKRAAVTERATARWNAELKGDLDTAYTFLTPATREVLSLAAYKARGRAVRYTAFAIDNVKCEAAACQVRILLTYDHRLMKGITTPLEEDWIIEGGQAWYVARF